ncbi:MAG: GNAT family N-acetyltransferase [Acidobacteriota bacterium]
MCPVPSSSAAAEGPSHVRDLKPDDFPAASLVLARAMGNNPLHLRLLDAGAGGHEAVVARLFLAVFERHHDTGGLILGAFSRSDLVGVCTAEQPGRHPPTPWSTLRMLPRLVSGGSLAATALALDWAAQWRRRDLGPEHWQLGPVGVAPEWQRRGVGTQLLRAFEARIDPGHAPAYLETDKLENVAFYERFGFQTIGDAAVLGVRTWFMVRERSE